MTLRSVGLATASIGAAVAFGALKLAVLRGGRAKWAIVAGLVLFVISAPAAGSNQQ